MLWFSLSLSIFFDLCISSPCLSGRYEKYETAKAWCKLSSALPFFFRVMQWRLCFFLCLLFVASRGSYRLSWCCLQPFLFSRSRHTVEFFFLRAIRNSQSTMVEKLTQTFTNGDHEPNLKIAIVGGGLVNGNIQFMERMLSSDCCFVRGRVEGREG